MKKSIFPDPRIAVSVWCAERLRRLPHAGEMSQQIIVTGPVGKPAGPIFSPQKRSHGLAGPPTCQIPEFSEKRLDIFRLF